MNTDVEWEKWGVKDPYFGVIRNENFRNHRLTEEFKKAFFETGKSDVNFVLEVCRREIDQSFLPKKVLDFGCGVGRLVIPFAQIAEQVVGLDVSDSMLKEAQTNCNEHGVQNARFFKSNDSLSFLDEKFDLIHSLIVFQHIPIERGRSIFTNLINQLNDGGICAIQITYGKAKYIETFGTPSWMNRFKRLLNSTLRRLVGIMKRQDPEMQMNSYNLNELFFLIQSMGVRDIYSIFTDHGGELGVYLFFQKPNLTFN